MVENLSTLRRRFAIGCRVLGLATSIAKCVLAPLWRSVSGDSITGLQELIARVFHE